jgi:hypothetical protein
MMEQNASPAVVKRRRHRTGARKGTNVGQKENGSLLAGAACLDITPERNGLWLAGHAQPRKANAVRDPLCVRTLFLSDGHESVSLSSLDLVGLRKIHVDEIRQRLSDPPDRGKVLLFTTHTHDAPDTIGYWGPRILGTVPVRTGIDPSYMERVQTQTVACIRAAREGAVPVRVLASSAQVPRDLTRNVRREGFKQDEIRMLWFRDRRDRTVAVLSNYPCHPEMLGHESLQVSAEFLTDLHRMVESRIGGVSIFFQDALGGMVTGGVSRDDGSFDPAAGEPFIAVLGETLGTIIVRALEGDPDPVEPGGGLRVRHREFTVPLRNRKLRLAARMRLIPAHREEIRDRYLRTEASLVAFGPVRMATVPGEALPELGFQIQAMLACPHPFVLCMGCDELGYILPRRYARNRNYRYENSMSVGPETANLLLARIREMVREDSAGA